MIHNDPTKNLNIYSTNNYIHMNYYDLVLLAVPLPLLLGGLTSVVLGIGTEITILIGGLISITILGHAMFSRPPTEYPSTAQTHTRESPSQPMNKNV